MWHPEFFFPVLCGFLTASYSQDSLSSKLQMKFSRKVLESILRERKSQREHTFWKLKNFKITQTPEVSVSEVSEDTETVSKG